MSEPPPDTAGARPGPGAGSGPGSLSPAQKQLLLRQQELNYWRTNGERIRRRNLFTGLAFGAFVVGMFTYTIMSVRQERVIEELDEEVRVHLHRGPRTGANS